MRTLHLACLWGARKYYEAIRSLELLKKGKDSIANVRWGSAGDRYFFAHSADFTKGRATWVALSSALEQRDPDSWSKRRTDEAETVSL